MLVESQMCDVCCSITNQGTYLLSNAKGLKQKAKCLKLNAKMLMDKGQNIA